MKKKTLVIVALALLLLLGALIGGGVWLKNTHVFVGMRPYPKDAESLDLRGRNISLEDHQELSQLLPQCKITWDVPFQEGRYPSDTKGLTLKYLTGEDLARLALFEELVAIDANGCTDYEHLLELQEAYPNIALSYNVTIGGNSYANNAAEVTVAALTEADTQLLNLLPELTTLNARGCTDYAQLAAFQQNICHH